jgi:D-arabinose 1-dehydrogenase-like Zn-dependent alcohol dehydrogenase
MSFRGLEASFSRPSSRKARRRQGAHHFYEDRLDNINEVLERMRGGAIEGRVVMRISGD